MAPLMPEGTNWWSGPAAGGVQYPGGCSAGAVTGWEGAAYSGKGRFCPCHPACCASWPAQGTPALAHSSCGAWQLLIPVLTLQTLLGAGAGTQYRTRRNPWSGMLGRPGNEYQDSLSALSDLSDSYYTQFHTYGVDWRPGEVRARRHEGVATRTPAG